MSPRRYHANNLRLTPDELALATDGFARLLHDAGHVENHATTAARRVALQAAGGGAKKDTPEGVTQYGYQGHSSRDVFFVSTVKPCPDGSLTPSTSTLVDYDHYTSNNLEPQADTWEDARQRNASERGWAYVAPATVALNATVQPDTDCLRSDGELARMCGIGFKHYVQYARWLILHDMSRAGGQGFTFDELYTRCVQLGVKGCETYTRRIIRKGIGFYWNYDPRTDKIYPVSYLTLCKRAIRYAHALGLHDLYLYGNHPGQRRDMYISVSGSGADFEGAILASWYGLHGCPTISRHTLQILLNRDARSIRRMERRACIRITYNEAQTTDPAAVPLNADGSLRGDVRYEAGVWNYRMPNSYTPRMTRQHHKRGQGRKAVCWFKHWLSSNRLPGRPQANAAESGMGKLNGIRRIYCETDKALNASLKRGVLTTLYVATGRQHRGRVWKVARNEDI